MAREHDRSCWSRENWVPRDLRDSIRRGQHVVMHPLQDGSECGRDTRPLVLHRRQSRGGDWSAGPDPGFEADESKCNFRSMLRRIVCVPAIGFVANVQRFAFTRAMDGDRSRGARHLPDAAKALIHSSSPATGWALAPNIV